MQTKQNIITIRSRNVREADKAFEDFMAKAEKCFNERSNKSPKLYKGCSPFELEEITEKLLKEICPSTPFLEEDIELMSGHCFPDIMVTDFYGVEVKSTLKDKWTSVGSSIVEMTRYAKVERIYMLFGNLGSNPPKFRCRPYQECLSNIAVTHLPRYLIDMSLAKGNNILSKMETDYDTFRKLDERSKISKVRSYFIQKAKYEQKAEMPWWMGDLSDTDRQPSNMNISVLNDQDEKVRFGVMCRAFILFTSIYSENASIRYKQIAMWLCNRYSFVCHNLRDFFSGGGMLREINGKRLDKPYPQVVGRLLHCKKGIEDLLKNPDIDILEDIDDYWDFKYDENDYYSSWLIMVERAFKSNPKLKDIPIRRLIENVN